MLIDTHTHLYLDEFAPDNLDAVRRAIDAGVHAMVMPNVDCSTVEPMNRLWSAMPERLHMAMGLHPTEIKHDYAERLAEIKAHLDSRTPYVGVGEIGIDLYWDKTYRSEQMQAFDTQVSWAEERNLPIIVHCRDGLDETLEVLSAHKAVRGVFHSFGGSEADVSRIMSLPGDFCFGINGIVTFKNSGLRRVLPAIGLSRILLETDSPYLAPVPHRGKRNESSYLPFVCSVVADSLGVAMTEAADVTTANASRLFAI